jgi:aspartokinase-like uncharacterized kinase
MRKTKAECQRAHTKRRLRERFGLHVSRFDMAKLVRDIQAGELECLGSETNRLSHFLWRHRGKEIRVVYDKHRHTVVTVLTPEMGFFTI